MFSSLPFPDFAMDTHDESNLDCEFVSENEVTTSAKGKRKQNKKAPNQKKSSKPPRAPNIRESPTIHTKKKISMVGSFSRHRSS